MTGNQEPGKKNQITMTVRPADICACCGSPTPEGRQICWSCEHMAAVDSGKRENAGNEEENIFG